MLLGGSFLYFVIQNTHEPSIPPFLGKGFPWALSSERSGPDQG